MKFSAAISLCVAPLAIAKAVNNVYPGRRDISSLDVRTNDKGSEKSGDKNNDFSGKGYSSSTEIIIIWINEGGGSPTNYVQPQVTVTATATVTAGAPQGTTPPGAGTAIPPTGVTHNVTVGGAAGLVYTPDSIQANVGDMVIFTFLNANHTVTQSAFTTPCEKLADGMDSGFQPNANNSVNPPPQVAMQVMVSTPLWFYCKQKGHCGKGMTFSINPTANKTQAMFQSMAIAQNGTGAGTGITGGTPAAPPAAGTTSSSAPKGTTAPAAGGSSGGSGSGGVTSGSGTINSDGSCTCAVMCAAGSFPVVNVQGVGAFGGSGGGLPMNFEVTP